MENLIIVGAGGFGREILEWARPFPRWRIKGFLDDNPATTQDSRVRAPVLGPISSYAPVAGDVFLCGLGTPALRRRVTELLRTRGAQFATLVHPSAIVATGARLSAGAIVCPFTVISTDAEIGEGAAI